MRTNPTKTSAVIWTIGIDIGKSRYRIQAWTALDATEAAAAIASARKELTVELVGARRSDHV